MIGKFTWAIRTVLDKPDEVYLLRGGGVEFFDVARFTSKDEAASVVDRLNQWEHQRWAEEPKAVRAM